MDIAFLIGACELAGGNYVMLQHALYLKKCGHEVTVIHMLPNPSVKWHPAQDALPFVPMETYTAQDGNIRPFDLVIATWWETVYHLHKVPAKRRAYFVQSVESWYCASEDLRQRRLIDATYAVPLPVITEARWIKEYLAREFGSEAYLARNGIRKDFLAPEGPAAAPREPGRLRVLVEGPLGVDFKNVPRTIRLAKSSGADEVWLLTSSDVLWYPEVDRVFSRVPVDRVAEIYRACDVLVKLSYVEGMFGPPLEMFHCGGTAVVYDITGVDEYIRHGENALVVPTGDEAGVEAALRRLRSSPELLARLKSGALETAAGWPGWDEASAEFTAAAVAIIAEPAHQDLDTFTALEPFRQIYEMLKQETGGKRSGGLAAAARMFRFFPGLKRLLLPLHYRRKHLADPQIGKRVKECSISREER